MSAFPFTVRSGKTVWVSWLDGLIAARMDPHNLKEAFGEKIVFWGGVDVQQFLPKASPEQVRHRIRELSQIFGSGGGYVMAPAHEMQKDIPPENIVAWVETIR